MLRRPSPAILAVLVIVGCGGAHVHPTLRGTVQDSFVARVDAICSKARQQGKAVKHTEANGNLLVSAPAAIERLATILTGTGQEMTAVQPPAKDRPAYERLVSGTQHEAVLLHELARYYRAHDRAAQIRVATALRQGNVEPIALALGVRCY
jgi:hypothetical protein